MIKQSEKDKMLFGTFNLFQSDDSNKNGKYNF